MDLTLATTVHNNVDDSVKMLESFRRVFGRDVRVVIVDDGSTEPVDQRHYPMQVDVHRNNSATGFCAASARALDAVETPFALLVDADVRFLEGDLHQAIDGFRSNPHNGWMGFKQVNFDGGPQSSFQTSLTPPWVFGAGRIIRQIYHRHVDCRRIEAIERSVSQVEVVHSSCALLRMDAYRAIRGFDLEYRQCESDTDLSLRFRAAQWRVLVDTRYVVAHEGSGGSRYNPSRILDLHKSSLRLYSKHRPSSRLYLKALLCLRHFAELGLLLIRRDYRGETKHNRALRFRMATGVWGNYRSTQTWLSRQSR